MLLFDATEDGTVSAVLDTANNCLTISRLSGDLVCDITKSLFIKVPIDVTAVAIDETKVYIATYNDNSCRVLVYAHRDKYMTELTCIDLSDVVQYVTKIKLKDTLVFMTQAMKKSPDGPEVVALYDIIDGEYVLRYTLTTDTTNVQHYGIDLVILPEELIILGTYKIEEEDGEDICYLLTLIAKGKKTHLLTGISQQEGYIQKLTLEDTQVCVNGTRIATLTPNGLTLDEVAEDEPTQSVEVNETPLIKTDTQALPEGSKATERHAMITRHHLLIQQLLNNISIAIKEDKLEKFAIKSLDLTEDRVRITGLEFITKKDKGD